ncbi:hypothetical protein B0T12DRAFT_255345 [Alternaria alternata]|nr:hypothetical protein B0T12DRAFT_255345 [Alternaria alternata]
MLFSTISVHPTPPLRALSVPIFYPIHPPHKVPVLCTPVSFLTFLRILVFKIRYSSS